MSDISERVLDRLENLENIEPLLGSLRILSLSTMQMALNRKTQLQTYKEEFMRILRLLLQTLQKDTLPAPGGLNQGAGRALLVVLGSERGICGMYNKNLAASAGAWQAAEIAPNQVQCFGGKLCQAMRQQGAVFDCHDVISQGSVPRYQRAQELVAAWLTEFKAGQLSAVDILSFRKPPSGFYKPVITRLIPLIAQLVLSGEDIETWPPPIIEGDGLQTRDFTYIDNVVHGNLLACHTPGVAGEVFNIACGGQINLLDMVAILNRLLGKTIEPRFTDPRPGDVRHSRASIDKARRMLGYEPLVSFEEGLARTLAWYESTLAV